MYIKVYYRPVGSDRQAKAKLYTVKKLVWIVNLELNTANNRLNISYITKINIFLSKVN